MAWTETNASNVGDNGCLEGLPLSADTSISPPHASSPKMKYEGKDTLSYANILRSRNKFVDALTLYKSILDKDSENVDAHIGKGICLQMQNVSQLAFESFSEAIRLDPTNACALTHCGILYKDGGRLVEASESYEKALRADPTYKPAAECLAIVLTDLGTSLKLAGSTDEGIHKYSEALKIDPHYAPAYYNLGVVYSEMAQFDTALCCYEKAALQRPMYAEAYCNMGVIYKNRGDLEAAISCYERCLAVSPNFEIAKNNMAIALTDLGTKVKLEGNIKQGVAYYKKALCYNWHYADAMYNLGVAYGEKLKFDKAIMFYELALHFNPSCAEACNNLGVIYKDRDNLDRAVECYQASFKQNNDVALSIKPYFSQSLNNLGVVYTVQGKMDAAASMIEKAIVANPMYAEAYNNLGVLYRDAGNISLAIEAYERCLQIDPDSRNAGQDWIKRKLWLLASISWKISVSQRMRGIRFRNRTPTWPVPACLVEPHSVIVASFPTVDDVPIRHGPRLSSIRQEARKKPVESIPLTTSLQHPARLSYIKQQARTPNDQHNLLALMQDLDTEATSFDVNGTIPMLGISQGALRVTLEGTQNFLLINRLLAMNYINEDIDDTLFEAHRDWGKRFMRLFAQYTSWDNPKDPERRLVVGYVSPDYFTHSVSYFIEAPLVYHDYTKYKVVVYSAVVKADAKTTRFRERVLKKGGLWREIYGIDEKKVASMVREDNVDILVELTGHTANNKLGMMACRPAPIQATWIGYPNTTGLPAIDYRITDSMADPPDTKQKNVEELVRLPECFLCYTPSSEAGPVSPAPALSNGFVTFGSFNNLAKITPTVMKVWARILCAVPNSRLVVKCKPFCCDSLRQKFLSTFEQLGLEPLRVDLLPLILLNHDHMQAYSLMDISLDTFPYAGTTTTCESLYMGVPCVTMGGSIHAHNVGVSLLSKVDFIEDSEAPELWNASEWLILFLIDIVESFLSSIAVAVRGLEHLVAQTENEYFQLAVKLASDITALSNLRMSLRDLMTNSPVCDGQKFTLGLESAFRKLWGRYCKGDIPSLRNMAALLQELVSEEQPVRLSDPTRLTAPRENSVSIRANGFNGAAPSMPNITQFEEI
ncbi:hypothetical protein GIB67_013663 [Kingdonia uniflora]|uniref:Probable UDP-N-acetylglucosamine--peptide N-acetylglucosaminyltransferase SPINDLY n=1 Tax=Kingdonia uniflora TaxID=39325 RepID=A0A7J7NQ62_9MAGN|nr:hypothetical protein GIB67_013663 [Kingdonia uniflora]